MLTVARRTKGSYLLRITIYGVLTWTLLLKFPPRVAELFSIGLSK